MIVGSSADKFLVKQTGVPCQVTQSCCSVGAYPFLAVLEHVDKYRNGRLESFIESVIMEAGISNHHTCILLDIFIIALAKWNTLFDNPVET